MPAQGIMVAVGDAEEEEDADVEAVAVEGEAVAVEGDEEELAPHLQTICETHKWQEVVEE